MIKHLVKRVLKNSKEHNLDELPGLIYDPETLEHMESNISDCNHERWRIPDLENGGYKKDSNGFYEYVDTNWVAHPEKRGYVSVWSIDHPVVNRWKDLRRNNLDIEPYERAILEAELERYRVTSPALKAVGDKDKLLKLLHDEEKRVSATKGLSFLAPHIKKKIEQEEKTRESLYSAWESVYADAKEKFLKEKQRIELSMKAARRP